MAHDYCGTLFGMKHLIKLKEMKKKKNRNPLFSDFENKGTKQ